MGRGQKEAWIECQIMEGSESLRADFLEVGEGKTSFPSLNLLLLPSPGEDPQCCGQYTTSPVPEGSAVLPAVSAKHGECQWV